MAGPLFMIILASTAVDQCQQQSSTVSAAAVRALLSFKKVLTEVLRLFICCWQCCHASDLSGTELKFLCLINYLLRNKMIIYKLLHDISTSIYFLYSSYSSSCDCDNFIGNLCSAFHFSLSTALQRIQNVTQRKRY
jgi:hypothetical protein